MATELDFDTAEALGLDGTGRDGNPRFPYTIENLLDDELILLNILAGAAVYDEREARDNGTWSTATWLRPSAAELQNRELNMERLAVDDMTSNISYSALVVLAYQRNLLPIIQKDQPHWHDGDVVQTQPPYDDYACTAVRIGGEWLVVTPDGKDNEKRPDSEIDEWIRDGAANVMIHQDHDATDDTVTRATCRWCQANFPNEPWPVRS